MILFYFLLRDLLFPFSLRVDCGRFVNTVRVMLEKFVLKSRNLRQVVDASSIRLSLEHIVLQV